MGTEHDTYVLQCGCVKHHTYDESCSMGPIAGTSKRWIVHCADCRKRELDKLLESLTVDETSDQ